MNSLVGVVNDIHDYQSLFGGTPIELPEIIVVGNQSVGKSSVLEALVGHSFLPRGTGMVTRCPLVLQLNFRPDGGAGAQQSKQRPGAGEWGEFLHAPGRRFAIADICAEIKRQTEVLAPVELGVSSDPITLRIYSPRVPNLTLVDLPGLVRVPLPGHPPDIAKQIRDLTLSYMRRPLSIILAVVPANADMATNDCLEMAQEVDPDGQRTLAVVTRLDNMDRGTNAEDVLTGRVIPVRLGIIGVVNRSQEDIDNNKSMEDAQAYEATFLQRNYPQHAARHGTKHLTRTLAGLLLQKIREHIPSMLEDVRRQIMACQAEIDLCGELVDADGQTQFLSDERAAFANKVMRLLDSYEVDPAATERRGGSRVQQAFQQLRQAFRAVAPANSFSRDQVVMTIRDTRGPKPPLPPAQVAFESLATRVLLLLEQPALACLSDVVAAMIDAGNHSHRDNVRRRYPVIRHALDAALKGLIEKHLKKTKEMVKEKIAIECGYINFYFFEEPDAQTKAPRMDAIRLAMAEDRPVAFKNDAPFLNDVADSEIDHARLLGAMLTEYFDCVATKAHDNIIKAIMVHLVERVKSDIHPAVTEALSKESTETLFQEEEAVDQRRTEWTQRLEVMREFEASLRVHQ